MFHRINVRASGLVKFLLARMPGLNRQMQRAPTTASFICHGDVPKELLPERVEFKKIEMLSTPAIVDAHQLIAILCAQEATSGPCIILTDRALRIGSDVGALGYAEPRLQMAIVSTHQLLNDASPERLKERLHNVIEHELGHLQGLPHCSRNCVMRPAITVADLDVRPKQACGRCRSSFALFVVRRALAAAVLILCVMGGDKLLNYTFDPGQMDFTCWAVDGCGRQSISASGAHDEVSIYFRKQQLLSLRDKGNLPSLRDRSLPAVRLLNQMARDKRAEAISIRVEENGHHFIGTRTSPHLLEILPLDVPQGQTPESVARQWARNINETRSSYAH